MDERFDHLQLLSRNEPVSYRVLSREKNRPQEAACIASIDKQASRIA
jgi:hypothetical protein